MRRILLLGMPLALLMGSSANAQSENEPSPPYPTTTQCYNEALRWARLHAQPGTQEYYDEFYEYFYTNCPNTQD
ncbi:hypothetical protein WR25_19231 [Diploscapter pachys]|jgi:hypothetical protein|uniref:Secreted protein n=1 Tax=Diploscapter pachys TaxID=2018661 RepID=A0A2A2KL82_9BILA|nr:hypothetical protein WR25_19231 [Diploscapter pachys]